MGKKLSTILIIIGLFALLGTGFLVGRWYYTHDIVRPVSNIEQHIKQADDREDNFAQRKAVIDSMNALVLQARDSGKVALARIRKENKTLETMLEIMASQAVDTSLHDPYPPSYMEDYKALEKYRENNRLKDSITDVTISGYEQQISGLQIELTAKDSLYSALRISFDSASTDNRNLAAANVNLQAKSKATPKRAGNIVWKGISALLAALLIYQSVK